MTGNPFAPRPPNDGEDLPGDPPEGHAQIVRETEQELRNLMDAVLTDELFDLLARVGFFDLRPACGCWGVLVADHDQHGYIDIATVKLGHQCGLPDQPIWLDPDPG